MQIWFVLLSSLVFYFAFQLWTYEFVLLSNDKNEKSQVVYCGFDPGGLFIIQVKNDTPKNLTLYFSKNGPAFFNYPSCPSEMWYQTELLNGTECRLFISFDRIGFVWFFTKTDQNALIEYPVRIEGSYSANPNQFVSSVCVGKSSPLRDSERWFLQSKCDISSNTVYGENCGPYQFNNYWKFENPSFCNSYTCS